MLSSKYQSGSKYLRRQRRNNLYPTRVVRILKHFRRCLKTIKSHINDKLTTNQQKEFRDFSFVNDELFNSTVSDLAENLTSAL